MDITLGIQPKTVETVHDKIILCCLLILIQRTRVGLT